MATPCCSEGNCCVFLRGTLFIRAAGGVYRALGNVSQFRLTHENSEYLPLNGELDPSCCEFEAVQAQIVLRCFDNANTLLGFGGEATSIAAGSVTETLTWTGLDVGSLLPFSSLADTDTIVVGTSTIGFTTTSYGLIAKDCVLSAGQVTVTYTRLKARTVNAGEACSQTYELMYAGTNSFDGSEVILTIPKIRLRSVSSFDWINQTDAGEMALEGTLLPQATSPVWYNFTRRDCTELCPCSTPVIAAPTLPLVFTSNTLIGAVTFSATPATAAALTGNLPTGITATTTTSGSTVTVTLTGTPTVAGQTWDASYNFTNACAGGEAASASINLGSGTVINDFPWFLRTSTFAHRAVAFGNGVWVASQAMGTTSTNAAINTSTDGVTWTAPASSTASETTNEVEFANGLFVHVGEAGRVTTSTDGVTWTQRAQLSGSTPRLRAVHFDNGLWVAVGGNGTTSQSILTSTNGTTWTTQNSTTTEVFQDVFFANGLWTAVGTFKTIWTSPDGVTWTSRSNPGTSLMVYNAVRYGNGLWVAVGSSGAILTSPDGVTWTLRTSGTTQQFNDVRFANNTWVAVGNNGIIRTSTDGITWVDGSVGATPLVNWTNVEYGDGKWVIGSGLDGLIYSSATAAAGSWINRTPTGSTGSVNDLLYANGKWVAVGDKISTTR
jgi:hypothetical protein